MSDNQLLEIQRSLVKDEELRELQRTLIEEVHAVWVNLIFMETKKTVEFY